MKKPINRTTAVQLAKYAIIGGMNTVITLIVIWVCTKLIGINFYVSNIIGYIAGLINSFIWNKTWVFHSHDKKLYHEMTLFLVGFLLCYGIQIFTVWAVMLLNPLTKEAVFDISPDDFTKSVATLAGMVVYTLANYIYNRSVTFHTRK